MGHRLLVCIPQTRINHCIIDTMTGWNGVTSDFISWTATVPRTNLVELWFRDPKHSNIADLKIHYTIAYCIRVVEGEEGENCDPNRSQSPLKLLRNGVEIFEFQTGFKDEEYCLNQIDEQNDILRLQNGGIDGVNTFKIRWAYAGPTPG